MFKDMKVKSNIKKLTNAKDVKVQMKAIKALDNLKDNRAIEPLIKALEDSDGDVRQASAEALGNLGDTRAVESLIKILRDSRNTVRKVSAKALGNLGDTHAVEPLINALEDSDDGVRQASAEALGNIGDTCAVKPLHKALWDYNTIRKISAEALDKIGESKWKQWVKGDKGDFRRLGESNDSYVIETIIGNLGNWDISIGIAETLGYLGDTRAVEPLIKALWANYYTVRKASAEALDKIGESKWKQWVKGDKDDFRRLGKSNDSYVIETIISNLGNWDISIGIAETLGYLGDTRAVEPLIKALGSSDSDVRRASAEALGNIGDTRAVEPLINAFKESEAIVSASSAEALGKLGDTRAVEPLINDLERLVILRAFPAKDLVGDAGAIPLILMSVIEALGELRDTRAIEPLEKSFRNAFDSVDRFLISGALVKIKEKNIGKKA